jgi:hypothetical protein
MIFATRLRFKNQKQSFWRKDIKYHIRCRKMGKNKISTRIKITYIKINKPLVKRFLKKKVKNS